MSAPNLNVDEWVGGSLGTLCELINGFAFKPDDWGTDGRPIIRIQNLNGGSDYNFFAGAIHPKHEVEDGDMLFAWSGNRGTSFGPYIWSGPPGLLNQHIFKVIPSAGVCREWLFFALDEVRERVERDAHGASGLVHVRKADLVKYQIHRPRKPSEQSKIAEVLSTVDRAIEQTEDLIAKQQRIKSGLMQDLLTRGINEHGNLRSEQTHKFKDSPLGRIPVEWEVCRLEDVADFVTSGSRGWSQYYSSEGALFLRIGNLTRKHINLRFDDIVRVSPPASSEGSRTSVSPGDLLISITADLGIIGVIPEGFEEAYVNQHIALVRLRSSAVDPRFIGWFLNGQCGQSQFDKLNESGAKAGLNLPMIKNLLVPTMEIAEQGRIAEVIDAATQKGFRYQQRLGKLRSIKAALMQDLLTGRKRVTALIDPTAEHP